MAWYRGTSGGDSGVWEAHPVATKKANAWGLFDMHGSVPELCADWYGSYPIGQVTDPAGPATGTYRVYRGGGYCGEKMDCRSAIRLSWAPTKETSGIGFRVAVINSR
jgi:sulfatase modifying factor 1